MYPTIGTPSRTSAGLRRLSRVVVATATAVAAALVVAACGGTSRSGATATTPAPASTSAPATTTPATTTPATTTPATTTPGSDGTGLGQLTRIAVGQHAGFDRIVFQFADGVPSSTVAYVPSVVNDGRGDQVPLPGQAFLHIVFLDGSAYGSYSGARVLSPVDPTVLQVRMTGDFEGYLSFGVGLSQRTGFTVLTLANPGRLVIDVADRPLPAFPGIWDITSWPQFWQTQIAYTDGHQPWLGDPRMVVGAWAYQWPQAVIRQVAANTFTVTPPNAAVVYTVTGRRPVTVGAAQLWVITGISERASG